MDVEPARAVRENMALKDCARVEGKVLQARVRRVVAS
jgi:hypothetical protein